MALHANCEQRQHACVKERGHACQGKNVRRALTGPAPREAWCICLTDATYFMCAGLALGLKALRTRKLEWHEARWRHAQCLCVHARCIVHCAAQTRVCVNECMQHARGAHFQSLFRLLRPSWLGYCQEICRFHHVAAACCVRIMPQFTHVYIFDSLSFTC
jgi:hypothetical protein